MFTNIFILYYLFKGLFWESASGTLQASPELPDLVKRALVPLLDREVRRWSGAGALD